MYKLLKILAVVVCLVNFVNSISGYFPENSFLVESNFVETNLTKVGNVMKCKIVKIVSNTTVMNTRRIGIPGNIPSNGIKINTTGYEQAYTFVGVQRNTKCASFQVRADSLVHLALSNVQISTAPDIIEIVIGYNGNTIIRKRANQIPLVQVSTPTFLSANEYRGFWIKWTDNHLITIGRDFETEPFIKYRSTTPLSVLFFGIQTVSVPGSWILYGNRRCPGTINTPTHPTTQQQIHAELQCEWAPINGTYSPQVCNNSACQNTINLQNQLIIILNELKVEYNVYNSIPKRTRALSNRILKEIEEEFTKAKVIKKMLFEKDNTANSQTFDSIIQLFYKFYELIQKDLMKCFQGCRH